MGAVVAAVALAVAGVAGADTASGPQWSGTQELSLPGDAVVPSSQSASVIGVSCPSAGNCSAVGQYRASSGLLMMAADERNGAWSAPVAVAGPSNALTTNASMGLNSVRCWSVGNCVAVGGYTDNQANPATQALYVTETNGVWGVARELPLPHDADTNDSGGDKQYATLEGISCTGPDACVAVGFYRTASQDLVPLVAVDSAGNWSSGTIADPSDASTPRYSILNGVDCTDAGDCSVVGYYSDQNHDYQGMVAGESGGVWQAQAAKLALPSDQAPAGQQVAYLNSVSCTTAGGCVAVGAYDTAHQTPRLLVAAESGSTWQQGVQLAMPAGAGTQVDDSTALWGVSCPAAGSCLAAGAFYDAAGNLQPLTVAQQGGTWSAPVPSSPPSNAATAPGAGYNWWAVVDCLSASTCEVGGSYVDSSGGNQPMVESSVGALSVASAGLPDATAGSAYSQTLAGSGGDGVYAWSLASGSLPPGLTLSSSGVISGTPITAGTYSFSVGLSDPGPPAQSASLPLSITVHTAPETIRIVKLSGRGAVLSASIACSGFSGGECRGRALVTSIERVRGKRVVATIAARRKRPKLRKLTIRDGAASYRLAGGRSETLRVHLTLRAIRLLLSRHRLPMRLAITPAGARRPAATRTLIFRLQRRKR